MPQIDPDNRHVLEPLFAPCTLLRVIIDAVLEQGYGTAVADSEQEPEVALLALDVHAVLGGRPDHPFARELIQGLSPALIVPGSDAWRRAVILHYATADARSENETLNRQVSLEID